MHDLVIRNARVFDGLGSRPVEAAVGARDGRIAKAGADDAVDTCDLRISVHYPAADDCGVAGKTLERFRLDGARIA